MEKIDYLPQVLLWAEQKGFAGIKSIADEFEDPTSYAASQGEVSVIPDISATRGGFKHYIEVATKTEDISDLVTKWKLLNMLAARRGGGLYLIIPKGHRAFVKRLTDDYQISARLVDLK